MKSRYPIEGILRRITPVLDSDGSTVATALCIEIEGKLIQRPFYGAVPAVMYLPSENLIGSKVTYNKRSLPAPHYMIPPSISQSLFIEGPDRNTYTLSIKGLSKTDAERRANVYSDWIHRNG